MKTFFKSGTWNAVCDVCGFTFKADQMKKRWDGLMVCSKDWEARHPQDLLRVPREDPSVPWTRTEDLSGYYACSVFNKVGIAGKGVAGCSVAGVTSIGIG